MMKSADRDYEYMEELYELYEQKIYFIAYSVLKNVQQAEDAVQETFITLYKNLEKIRKLNAYECKCYILKIAKNKAIDSYRKNKRHGTFLEEYQREQTETVNENIEEWEKQTAYENQIDTLLTELSESCKQVFKYRVFFNLSYQEISNLMGLTEVTVRKQFERARKRIHTSMGGIQNDDFKKLKNV